MERKYISLQNTILKAFCLHSPFGAGPGLRPVICIAVFSAILLYNQTHRTIQKTFFFLVHTSIKTVLKNTIVEKDTFSLKINDLRIGFTLAKHRNKNVRTDYGMVNNN